jgi:hypothetical protein
MRGGTLAFGSRRLGHVSQAYLRALSSWPPVCNDIIVGTKHPDCLIRRLPDRMRIAGRGRGLDGGGCLCQ